MRLNPIPRESLLNFNVWIIGEWYYVRAPGARAYRTARGVGLLVFFCFLSPELEENRGRGRRRWKRQQRSFENFGPGTKTVENRLKKKTPRRSA